VSEGRVEDMVVGCMVVVMREHECVGWRTVTMLELGARGVFRVGFADIREIEKWVVRFWRRVIGMRVRAVMFWRSGAAVDPGSIDVIPVCLATSFLLMWCNPDFEDTDSRLIQFIIHRLRLCHLFAQPPS
jgi:hypothetical protein